MMTRLAAWIAEQLQVALVLRAVLALLPLVALSFYSGNTLWLQAAVVTMSALIVEGGLSVRSAKRKTFLPQISMQRPQLVQFGASITGPMPLPSPLSAGRMT